MEFRSEIKTLTQVEHLNLVKFYGYLEHGDERIVVVEYLPNGTLRQHLDGELLLFWSTPSLVFFCFCSSLCWNFET